MPKPTFNLKTSRDLFPDVEKALADLANMDVLVGIPEENDGRQEEGAQIDNAELLFILSKGTRSSEMRNAMAPNLESGMAYGKAHELYIHEHGSPLWHTPPRPVLEPAIEHPENKELLAADLKVAAEAALDGHPEQALSQLKRTAIDAQNVAREWFVNPANGWAPNAPSTIEAKGSDRPNVDTGEVRKNIVGLVSKSGERQTMNGDE
jgi:hypothetical protein